MTVGIQDVGGLLLGVVMAESGDRNALSRMQSAAAKQRIVMQGESPGATSSSAAERASGRRGVPGSVSCGGEEAHPRYSRWYLVWRSGELISSARIVG
ncbi:MAG: hypothetical protein LC808_16455 [Actinobacteria bacterium]|nr:hypothetical protein [Actinomycetota bacterium]